MRPADAGTGATPQSRGEGPLRPQPFGLVPRGDQQLAGGINSDARQRDQLRGQRGDQRGELGVQVVDLGLQSLPAAGQRTQRHFGRGRRVMQRSRAQSRRGADPLAWAQLAELVADRLGGGEDHGIGLGAGLIAGLHGPFPGHPQHADHLHLGIAGFRGASSPPGLHGAGSGFGIQRVGFAVPAAGGAVRPVHLHTSRP